MPKSVNTFLESIKDWKGKNILLFANSYTKYPVFFKTSCADAKKSAPTAHVIEGLFNVPLSEHARFLEKRWENSSKK